MEGPVGVEAAALQSFIRIKEYCSASGITFFATAHDEKSLDFLASIEVPLFKIGSGEIGNWPFIKKVAKLGKPVIISVGMYEPSQVAEALESLASTGNTNVAVLHCVTDYPTSPADVALQNMLTLRKQFNVVTGYSDHTAGYHIPLAAVALGAKVIEKHITLDTTFPTRRIESLLWS